MMTYREIMEYENLARGAGLRNRRPHNFVDFDLARCDSCGLHVLEIVRKNDWDCVAPDSTIDDISDQVARGNFVPDP